jgi:hypothetical protein
MTMLYGEAHISRTQFLDVQPLRVPELRFMLVGSRKQSRGRGIRRVEEVMKNLVDSAGVQRWTIERRATCHRRVEHASNGDD